MYPELFEIPFVHVSVKSYGLMMVIGFVAAVTLMKRLSRDITPDPRFTTNLALYSLIAGVVGARLFFIVHHFDNFQGHPLDVFAIWEGGTVAQSLSLYMIILGVIFMVIFKKIKPKGIRVPG